MTRSWLRLALCATWIYGTIAEFTTPSSSDNDFTQRWYEGDTMHIAWNKGWSYGVDGQPKTADLFVAWFDDSIQNPWWRLLTTNIPTNVAGHYDWVIDVDATALKTSTQYRLRLIAHATNPVYNLNVARMPSKGFNIYPAPANSSSSSGSAKPTSSRPSSSSRASSSHASSASETSSPNETKKSSNAGAIAGGIVGGLAGLAIILGIILFALKRVKQKRKAELAGDPYVEAGMGETKAGGQDRYASTWAAAPVELDSSPHTELPTVAHPRDAPTTELEGSIPRHSLEDQSGKK